MKLQYRYTLQVQSLQFEWEPRKAAANLRKHRVSFAEAKTDADHSSDEDRFTILGISARLRILVVCHCYRQAEDVIRIISARKANRTERAQYLERITP